MVVAEGDTTDVKLTEERIASTKAGIQYRAFGGKIFPRSEVLSSLTQRRQWSEKGALGLPKEQ